MRLTRIVPILVAALAAAACTSTPTGSRGDAREARIGQPRLQGGVMYGSGNRAGSTTDSMRIQNGTAASTMEAAAAGGGVMYGSGN